MSMYIGDTFMPWPMNRVLLGLDASNTVTVDASGEKVVTVYQAPHTGSITDVVVTFGAVTDPTGNVDIRLETVNTATGEPTGTLFGSNTNVLVDGSSLSAYNSQKFTLTSGASVTQGSSYFAIVYAPPATPGSVTFIGWADAQYGFPYSKFYSGASWGTTTNRLATWPLYSDGPAIFPQTVNAGNAGRISINSSLTYDHWCVQMKSPVDLEVIGMYAFLDLDQDATLKLILGDNDVKRTCDLTSAYRPQTSRQLHYGYFAPFTVLKDTAYRYTAYTPSTSSIVVGGIRCGDTSSGDTVYSKTGMEGDLFYDVVAEEGEITTPFWQDSVQGSLTAVFPAIGPIVRRIVS